MQHSMEHLEQSAKLTRAAADACPHPVAATGMHSDGSLYCKACGDELTFADTKTTYTDRVLLAARSAEGRELARRNREAAELLRADELLCAGRA